MTGPHRLRTINIAGTGVPKTAGGGYGEAQRPSAPRQWPRESPPPPPRRTPLDNRSTSWAGWARKTASSGRVFGAVAHLSKSRRTARRRYSITDWMPGMGDHRPRHRTWLDDQPTLRAVGTFDVCSSAAVNSDLFCSLYGGRLKRPYLHCRTDALA